MREPLAVSAARRPADSENVGFNGEGLRTFMHASTSRSRCCSFRLNPKIIAHRQHRKPRTDVTTDPLITCLCACCSIDA